MAVPLVSLACARPSTLPTATTPFSGPASHFALNSQTLLSVAFRRISPLGTGKHSESGYGVSANQLTNSHFLKAIFNSETNSSASASDDENDLPPAGCSRIKVELTKPLGIAFEEDEFGNMYVGEVIEGGNAYKSGLIEAGDQLIATSAIVYGSEEDYQGVMVRKGMQIIRLNVRGRDLRRLLQQSAHIRLILRLL